MFNVFINYSYALWEAAVERLPASHCPLSCWRPNHNEVSFSLWIANNCSLFPCHLLCKPHLSCVLSRFVVIKQHTKHSLFSPAPSPSLAIVLTPPSVWIPLPLRHSISQDALVNSSRDLEQFQQPHKLKKHFFSFSNLTELYCFYLYLLNVVVSLIKLFLLCINL